MKSRFSLGLLALAIGLTLGFGVLVGQAHAAAPSTEDLAAMQSALDLTQATLDLVQAQINRNAIQNPVATAIALGNVENCLLGMRSLLAEAPQAPTVSESSESSPAGEVAGTATVDEAAMEQKDVQETTSPSANRAFWIVLVAAVVIAAILAMPRKKEVAVLQSAPQEAPQPQQPEPQSSEGTETVQSA